MHRCRPPSVVLWWWVGTPLSACQAPSVPAAPIRGTGIVVHVDGDRATAQHREHALQMTTLGTRRDGKSGPPPTGWWRSTAGAMEQGWTAHTPPPGTGPLHLDVQTDARALHVDHGVVAILGEDGHRWSYGPAFAWDDDGRALELDITAHEGTLTLTIDDTDAVWPLTIDPVLRTAPWSSSSAHEAIAGAGDVDGDGLADVMLSARGGSTALPGQVWIHRGTSAGPSASISWTLSPPGGSWQFGRDIAGVGDINSDGYDDVLIGEDERVLLFAGSASGPSLSQILTEPTGAGATDFGGTVASAGDVNNDGHNDVLVGAPASSAGAGTVWLYLGTPTGLDTTPAARIDGATGGRMGTAAAGIGDVNGDGYDDIAVGASTWNTLTGYVEVWQGSTDGIESAAALTLQGSAPYCNFGQSLDGAGDINSDGHDDLVVGAFGCAGSLGTAEVFLGSGTGLASTAATTLYGASSGAKFGQSVAGAGDVDNDGHDDIIVGGHGTTQVAALFHGSASGLETTPRPALSGGVTFGKLVAGTGDVDGDGHNDVLIADPGAPVVEWHPGDVDIDGDGWAAAEDCDDTDTAVGTYLLRWMDEDGDGHGNPAAPVSLCAEEAGAVDNSDDCNDTDPTISPLATELPGDGVDQNCDGQEACYRDGDGDGWRTDTLDWTTVVDCTAAGLALATTPTGDCDDTDPTVSPGAAEACDGVDGDCDGRVDQPTPEDAPAWARDRDGDHFAGDGPTVQACEPPPDHIVAGGPTDCDDTDPDVWPGAPERSDDGIDQDCDGQDQAGAAPEPQDTAAATPTPATPGDRPKDGATCATMRTPALSMLVWIWGLALAAARRPSRRNCPSLRVGHSGQSPGHPTPEAHP